MIVAAAFAGSTLGVTGFIFRAWLEHRKREIERARVLHHPFVLPLE
jgi:hypothetical protein